MVKNLPASAVDARDMGYTPGLERSPEIGNGNMVQYLAWEKNPMDGGAWPTTVHGVGENQTRLSTV